MRKIVSNQISPNLFFSDWFYAGWKSFLGEKCAKEIFEQFFCTKSFFLCNTARSALWKICELAELPKTKKIGIPAFICGVVATPFLAHGYQIKWIDTDKNGLMDFDDFVKKSDTIGLLVAPHIFGQTLDIQKFTDYAHQKNILVIEDGAHAFDLNNSNIIADVKIASFGREKVFSCVSGGAVFWNKKSPLAEKLKNFTPPKTDKNWENKHWMQIFWYGLALPWWNWGGKIIPTIAKKINLLPLAVTTKEKNGKHELPITALGQKQQWILHQQFTKLNKKIEHNKKIANEWKKLLSKYFSTEKILVPANNFRVILQCKYKTQQKILKQSQQHKYYLRDWDGTPIAPAGIDLSAFKYKSGQCKMAEKFAQNYVTFPTNLRTNISDVEQFEKILEKIF